MKTAIDSSVLFAIFNGEKSAQNWVETLAAAKAEGILVICDIVYAEVSPGFNDAAALDDKLDRMGIVFEPINREAAFLAGKLFRSYRDSRGTRTTLIPDFLIGAHAQVQADRLAANDTGYRRRYFGKLPLLTIET
jgi:predicted nucleic acid-binding protein